MPYRPRLAQRPFYSAIIFQFVLYRLVDVVSYFEVHFLLYLQSKLSTEITDSPKNTFAVEKGMYKYVKVAQL